MDGLIAVMRHGFKHRGIKFRVCYFKPESSLNQTATELYVQNEITVNRQWFYSADTHKSVDMVIAVNGIPVFAFELKNQYTGQNVDNAKRQWMYDRDPREICFQFNKRKTEQRHTHFDRRKILSPLPAEIKYQRQHNQNNPCQRIG